MDSLLFNKLAQFVREYGQGKAFRSGDIEGELTCYLASDNCLWLTDDDNPYEVTAVLCYEITEYFPLTVTICELVCSKDGAMAKILEELGDRLPPSFKLQASRKFSTKTVDYKNPRRILKLIQRLHYGSRQIGNASI